MRSNLTSCEARASAEWSRCNLERGEGGGEKEEGRGGRGEGGEGGRQGLMTVLVVLHVYIYTYCREVGSSMGH